MSKPPQDVEPSELFPKLSEPLPTEVIAFPRMDRSGNPIGNIRIRVLTMEDHNRARINAQSALKKSVTGFGVENLDKSDMDSPAVREVLGDLVAHEILCLACLSDKPKPHMVDAPESAEKYARVFHNPGQLRQVLTADETLTLFEAYRLVQYKWGPFEMLTGEDGELEAWVKRLEEGARSFPLLALSLPQLHQLMLSSAERISLLSRILVSQWESLPPSLASQLEPYCMGTGSSGELLENYTRISTENSPEVTLEMARRSAESEKNATIIE